MNHQTYKQQIVLLGASGSVGKSFLQVLRLNQSNYQLFAIVANQNVEKMLQICLEFQPQFVVMRDEKAAKSLSDQLKQHSSQTNDRYKIIVLNGDPAIIEMVTHPDVDTVVAAIVGASGLQSALAAAQAGKRILLANKEALVISGPLFMNAVQKHNATLLPLDSEHNALFQCLPKHKNGSSHTNGVARLILSASGGPFRTKTLEELQHVTLAQALKHPNWQMGEKITIDSASLMNKGLELIEAHFLFNLPADQLDVIVHPESIIHSLVEYQDGSFLAQMSHPDMAIPIAHALAYPERIPSGAVRMNLAEIAKLTFQPPDQARFPCLRLAKEALQSSQSHLVALNAANEIAVEAFLKQKITFMQIPYIIEKMLENSKEEALQTLEDLLEYDHKIRTNTSHLLTKLT